MATTPVLVTTVLVAAAGVAMPYTRIGAAQRMVALPPSYYGFLAATTLAYCVTAQLAKMAYIRAFRSWL